MLFNVVKSQRYGAYALCVIIFLISPNVVGTAHTSCSNLVIGCNILASGVCCGPGRSSKTRISSSLPRDRVSSELGWDEVVKWYP